MILSWQGAFGTSPLAETIKQTLGKRGTGIPRDIVSFSDGFAQMKQVQWDAFHRRLGGKQLPGDFREVVVAVRGFLLPIVTILHSDRLTGMRWTAPGPWA